MQTREFFKTLASREKAILKNPALGQVLTSSLHDSVNMAEIVPLVAHYLIAEVGYVYQHFGFCIFSPSGRTLLAEQLVSGSGLDRESVSHWLESVCYFLLEDFNILRLVDGEPDWKALNSVFFRELSKRIICAEAEDFSDLGLDCWNPALTRSLREVAAQCIELAKPETLDQAHERLAILTQGIPFGSEFAESLGVCFEEISSNPLRLLVWRVESFSTFADMRQEARLFLRANSQENERRASVYAALIALFLNHRAPIGVALLPPSPLTLAQLSHVLASNYSSPHFDCTLLRTWLELEDAHLQQSISELVQGALELGLLFQVPIGRFQKGYGLTRSALRILAPFHAAITNSLLRGHEDPATTHSNPSALPQGTGIDGKKEAPVSVPA